MSRWEQHNLANQLRPDQKRLGLLRQPVQAQSVQPRLVQPRPVQPAFQPTNVMDAPVSNMPSARQQRLDKYANTLTNMSLFATLATGKSIRDYGAAFRTQPTDQKDKVQDQIYSNIGALLQKARAAGVDLSDQRKVYELGTQAGITDPRYMKVLLDAAKNSRAPARETDFTSFYDKGGNESRYIKGTQGYSDAVENKNLTTQKPTAYDLGTLWNAKGESITYKNRQQELAAREVGFNRASPPKAADAKKYDAFSLHGPNGERRKGYRKHVDGVPRYFFSDDGTAVPANWTVGSPTEGAAEGTNAYKQYQEESALILSAEEAERTFGKNSSEHKQALKNLERYQAKLIQRTETGPAGAFGLSKEDVEEAAVEAVSDAVDISTFSSLLNDVTRLGKGAGGIRGVAIEKIGGVLGQIDPSLEEGFSQVVGGLPSAEAASIRNRLRMAVVSLIPDYTGEESARISDRERILTEEASRLTEPTASPTQIRQALKNVLELKLSSQMRNMMTIGVSPRYDLSSKDGTNRLGNELVGYGFSIEETKNVLRHLKKLQKALNESAGLANG